MKSIITVETFFNKEFSNEELKNVIDNLRNKEDFYYDRPFIQEAPNNVSISKFNNSDVVLLSLIEKEVNQMITNTQYSPGIFNELVRDNRESVCQKIAYDVLKDEYSNRNKLFERINSLCKGKNIHLASKQLNNLIEDVNKEVYYVSNNNNNLFSDNYNYIKNFNSERTNSIDFYIKEELYDQIKKNKSIPEIISLYEQHAHDYSNVELPKFLNDKITVDNFQEALKEIKTLDIYNTMFIPKNIACCTTFLISNMGETEREKINNTLKKNKFTNENEIAEYFTKQIINKKSVTKENHKKIDNERDR